MAASNNFSTCVFFSRLQPGHNGHLSAMKQGVEQGIKKMILGIGSADKERTQENPFTLEERKKIADALICALRREYPEVEVEVCSVMDFGDNGQRKSYIENTFPPFDTIISGNPIVQEIRPEKNIIKPDFALVPYRGTHIRYQIGKGDWKTLALSVSTEVLDVLHEISAEDIIREIDTLQPKEPKIATDLIIMKQGKYIVGKRKFAPYGLALLGGHLDPGETLKECALREGYEELFSPDDRAAKIILRNDTPFLIHDDPHRDPRDRVIAFVYEAEILDGTPVGNDDITELLYLSPEEIIAMPVTEFAFADHKQALLKHIGVL